MDGVMEVTTMEEIWSERLHSKQILPLVLDKYDTIK